MHVPRLLIPALGLIIMLGSAAAHAAAPLPALLVQRSDLRPGYRKLPGPGYTHTLQMQDQSPISSRILKSHGYIITYSASFADGAKQHGGQRTAVLVMESADKYRTVAGARWGYRRDVHAHSPDSFPTSMAPVGSESAAFAIEPPNSEIDLFFTDKTYAVRIGIAAQKVTKSSVLSLARLIAGRIHSSG